MMKFLSPDLPLIIV